MAWLVSDCKRAEYAHNARVMRRTLDERKPKGLFQRARGLLKKDSGKDELVAAAQALKRIEPDTALVGIEGRGPTKETRIDFGMGPACLFSTEEVSKISSALSMFTETIDEPMRPTMDTTKWDLLQAKLRQALGSAVAAAIAGT